MTRHALRYRRCRESGLCPDCGKRPSLPGGVQCETCKEARDRRRQCALLDLDADRGIFCHVVLRPPKRVVYLRPPGEKLPRAFEVQFP